MLPEMQILELCNGEVRNLVEEHRSPVPLVRGLPRCQRCGGQVLRDYYGWFCLQCGAEHNKNGKLVATHILL